MNAEIKVGKRCIHRIAVPTVFRRNEWEYDVQMRDVKVLAISGVWAMVRLKGCAPYVASVKELLPATTKGGE